MKLLFVGAFALTASLTYAQVTEPNDSIQKTTVDSNALEPIFEDENVSLKETLIIGKGVIDLQDDRKTPIAATTIKKEAIEQKVGGLDITQAFVNTPSITVAGQSGGFGESRVVTRGFDQSNTAFLLNGQPINGMEDGKVYWSNWSGMSDVANAVQIQRGLGSSKLAISSVGGTYNFVTKATDKKQGGFISAGVGNNNLYKGTVAYNTGLINNKFGVSLLFSHWQGDGYNLGSKGQGQNYFVSFGYKPTEKHTLNFLITGAPQWHDQNSRSTIATYLKYGRKYNPNIGELNGKEYNVRRNYYHKPVANLNWDWEINNQLSLSTVVYASWGRGGGSSSAGSFSSDATTGLKNIQEVFDRQSNGGESKGYVYSSINNHQWFGAVSNLTYKIDKHFNFNVGVDVRTFKGEHYKQLNDLLGGDYAMDFTNKNRPNGTQVSRTFSKNPWKAISNYAGNADEKLGWDYDEKINYGGLFAQFEYAGKDFTAFFQGAISDQTNKRLDRFNYLDSDSKQKSEKLENVGYNLKGGVSYSFAQNHQVFANAGYYSRQPFQNNLFMNYKNDVNPFAENEEIVGIEAGYKFKAKNFWANLNAYYTTWANRITSTSTLITDETNPRYGQYIYTVNRGVEEIHKGLELEVNYKPLRTLTLTGFASLGDWTYKGKTRSTKYDEDQNVVSEEAAENWDGLKVGDAAQTQFGLGATYEIVKGLSVDADYRYNGDFYSSKVDEANGNLQLPSYNLMDAGVTYNFNVTPKNKFIIRFNVNNVLNHIYISEASTNYQDGYKGAENYNGVNVNNQVYFGYGRTWNASVKFTF